jgi:hypothetical protein
LPVQRRTVVEPGDRPQEQQQGRQKEKAEEGKKEVEGSVHWVSTGWALQTNKIETLTMQAIEPKETKCLSRLHPPTQPLHSLSKQWLSPDREANGLPYA